MASIDKQMQLLGSQARALRKLLLFRRLNSGPWPFQRCEVYLKSNRLNFISK